jgi:DNA-binding LacI/PurR family transcriptional regulator
MAEITIYDVATKAGVSIATVSNVLNAPIKVKVKTMKRVMAAIDELGFVPRTEAIAKARKGVGRIGVLAPFTTYPSFQQRLRGVIEALRDKPYEVVIYDQESLAVRQNYLHTLPIARRIDGLIVMSLPFDDHVAQRLLTHELPTVLVEFAKPTFSSVDIDNVAGGRLAAEYLLSKGHTRIAFIGERQVSSSIVSQASLRLQGFKEALAEVGVKLTDRYISLAPHSIEDARKQAHDLLALPKPPTAIFTHSDIQAIGVLKAAKDKGLNVPKDLAVIGFDDLESAEHVGLTTVRQPLVESGQVATRLLLEQRDSKTHLVQQVTLPVSIVPRESA